MTAEKKGLVRAIWNGPFYISPLSRPVSVGDVLLKTLETLWRAILSIILLLIVGGLNTSERWGAIRYQYMGQDARYVVKAMQIEGREVSGRADFQSSSTGETRGNPIVFTYDSAADTLKDGAASASCQNRETNEQG